MFLLLFLFIPNKSVVTVMIYFFSIIKQFDDSKQDYLEQHSDYKTIFSYLNNVYCPWING